MPDEQTPWTLQSMARSIADWFTDPTNLRFRDFDPTRPGAPSPVSNVPALPPRPTTLGGPPSTPTIGPFRGRMLDARDRGATLRPFGRLDQEIRGGRTVT